MGPIPDGWNDYVRTGKRIIRTRFIAFKVPLREAPNQNCNITEENKWYPKLLVTHIPDIGIVIDITNTSKYYNPKDFLDLGVDHKKIFVEGHQIPSKENYKIFRRTVKKFLQDNKDNDKLIGVHCTHGLNRTGFLVCRYMIEEMNMTADEAISLFEDARGHKIKRENYLNKLKSLANNSSPTLDSDSNSGVSSPSRRHITKRPASNNRSQRARPTIRASHSDNRNGDWRYARPPSPTSFSHHVDRYQHNRHIRSLPYPPQNGNWRDPSHHYTSSRPMNFNAIPSHSHRNQREPNRPDRAHPSSSSRYTWRRDHHL